MVPGQVPPQPPIFSMIPLQPAMPLLMEFLWPFCTNLQMQRHAEMQPPRPDDQMPLHRGAHLASQQVASCDGVPVFLMAMMLQLLLVVAFLQVVPPLVQAAAAVLGLVHGLTMMARCQAVPELQIRQIVSASSHLWLRACLHDGLVP